MRQPQVPLRQAAKAGKVSRWWCRVPRCHEQGDGTIVDWRKHYVAYHMKDTYR